MLPFFSIAFAGMPVTMCFKVGVAYRNEEQGSSMQDTCKHLILNRLSFIKGSSVVISEIFNVSVS